MESTVITSEASHQASGAGPHGATSQVGSYEFNDGENAVVEALASRMYFVGWFTLAVGIFVAVLGTAMLSVGSILSGTLYAVIGLWTHRASVSFSRIARSRGKDMDHLMFALRDLKNLYTLQIWICTFTLAAGVFGVLALLWRGIF